VLLLLFACPVLTHSINSTKKKMTFECKSRMCERVVHVVEIACIFADYSTTTNHKNKFALAINACWQNFFCDMCVTLPTLLKNIFNTWLAAPES
jgi:hypothetical protein